MENEIKVGEYVRTREGYIGKLVEYIPNALNYLKIDVGRETIHCDNSRDNFIYTRYGFQLKHSPNLIDLIQCGDYVNGIKIISIIQQADTMKTISLCGFDNDYLDIKLNNRDIKTVVTKEQFESISYKVERKD